MIRKNVTAVTFPGHDEEGLASGCSFCGAPLVSVEVVAARLPDGRHYPGPKMMVCSNGHRLIAGATAAAPNGVPPQERSFSYYTDTNTCSGSVEAEGSGGAVDVHGRFSWTLQDGCRPRLSVRARKIAIPWMLARRLDREACSKLEAARDTSGIDGRAPGRIRSWLIKR